MAQKLHSEKLLDRCDLRELLRSSCCVTENSKPKAQCVYGECDQCKDRSVPMNQDVDFAKPLKWEQWKNQNIDIATRRDMTGATHIARVTSKRAVVSCPAM